jgi:hypothetical protein
VVILAIFAAALGYGVMTFLMTATPISMHKHSGFSLEDTKLVIQSHIVAMYLPSFLAGPGTGWRWLEFPVSERYQPVGQRLSKQ